MGNRLRLRISRIIPAMCGSKGHSRNNANPDPAPARSSTIVPTVLPKPNPRRPSSLRRHVSRALKSCGMTGKSKPALSSDDERDHTGSEPKTGRLSQWEREEKYWQVVEITETPRRKVYSSADENDAVVSPPPPSSAETDTASTKRRARQRRRGGSTRRLGFGLGPVRVSTSSAESGLFTNDETETLVSSSRSFSTEYSSSPRLDKTTTEKKKKKKKRKKERKSAGSAAAESEQASPARLSVFQRMVPCRVEGKVRESFAVVKRSDDPYEDFKVSMTEMILEKQMFDDHDLEQLLHCFLSLNSKAHHGLIVRAFVDIWEALFSGSLTSTTVSSSRRLSTAL